MFSRAPLGHFKDIPFFEKSDEYIENYKQIALDHVASLKKSEGNPFMSEDVWKSSQKSTENLIIKHLGDHGKILEVGVGLGALLKDHPEFDKTGIDLSFDYLQYARDNGYQVAMANVENLPFHNDSFDAVIACDILEHVLDLHQASREILRVLKPGGMLFVRVPFKDDLKVYSEEYKEYEFVHLRSFDLYSLKLHFQKVFKMCYIDHSFSPPFFTTDTRININWPATDSRYFALSAEMYNNSPVSFRERVFRLLHRVCMGTWPQNRVCAKEPIFELLDHVRMSKEKFIGLLSSLKNSGNAAYDAICNEFIYPLEINVVFKKAEASVPLADEGQGNANA